MPIEIENAVLTVGMLYKVSGIIKKENKRFLVLNPFEGTLTRYKLRKDYPLKPKFSLLFFFLYNIKLYLEK